jgi:hypothetical protein
VTRAAPTGLLLMLLASPALAELDAATRAALHETYYEYEVAGYCSLVTADVAAGFERQAARVLADAQTNHGSIDQATIDHVRGKAWQAAHWEWQNRGLGGFRAWCRNEGKAAAERFLNEPS